jgi:Ni,Fe-hydrogenase I large subunit
LLRGLAEEHGNGLLPRLAAQLLELASLQRHMARALHRLGEPVDSLAVPVGEGVGIAMVAAARGLLVHRVAVQGHRIRDYRILAPTEWNFHPRGVVANALSSLTCADDAMLERQASLLVTAVDPCVEYHVTVS